ncbi:hypothetical protein GGS26DRAFT_593786 [Hypomontagnella submonticulosa]|nr:hypothetical protein GGS26DRAFT_593786 [Hypomontagnella submonticulosa]
MSNSATFSYAQAAKGQSAVQSTAPQSNPTQSQAPSTTSTQSRDIAPTPSTRAPSVAVSTSSNELDGSQNTRSSSVKPESVSLNSNDSDTMSITDKAAELSSLPSRSTEKVLGEVVPQSTERRGRGHTFTSQTTDAGDGKKARKGKKSKIAEKESDQDQDQDKKENVPPKPELSEAPLPAVNVWTQRQEAYAAKAKTSPSAAAQSRSSNGTTAGQPEGLTNSNSQIHKRLTAPNDGVDATAAQGRSSSAGVKAPKKDAEQVRSNSNPIPRRVGPRGTRMNGETSRQSLETLSLNANNNSSWPTPETAASGLKTQVQAGKPEKEEKEESGPSKPRQKKEWQVMDFVPSVTFETPMPTRGSRGGRAGGPRGGREAAVRGNHAVNPSTDRTQENGTASGATSVASSASKRAPVDAAASREGRKPQAQTGIGKVPGDTSSASQKADLKATSADQAQAAMGQQAASRSASQRTDETKLSQPTRENGAHGAKDSGFQGQSSTNRSERTRGNARGRGAHPGMNGVAHPQSQFGQGATGYNYPTNASMRQPANPYANGYGQVAYGGPYTVQTTGSQHRSRPSSGSNRTQGGSRHQSSRASYPVVGVPYDTAVYHGSGPYPPTFADPNHILSGVLSQVEYYFSIDNLCKDTYLRQFMDSQGFVPLGVIATFKRMQEIAQDYQIIRIACDSSPHIEFVVTETGEDKVRRRDKWEPWVLEMHTRHPSARHDGPVNYRPYNNQMTFWPQMPQYGGEGAPMFSPTGTDSHFPLYNGNDVVPQSVNGVNGHSRPSESQLSATVPEFSPVGNPGMGASSQQCEVLSDVSGKKVGASPFGEQASPLVNGSHAPGNAEPIANGIGASHDAAGY